jgi:L-ascorbate metabolism protein UlaG (beta-lactamase superfamily)
VQERSDTLRITWINHATTLIQVDGINILTDPIWSQRASPVNWIGPQRQSAPGLSIKNLPPIDAVIISHNHYDHMDLDTLKRLNDRDQPTFLTPLANKHYLENVGISKILELDWWQSHRIGKVTIVATPAQHWSKRTLFDANRALWSGFYVQGEKQSVFFAGDTAYESHFTVIKQKLGPPTVVLMPIGAYKPRWFMKRAHTNPEEAVLAHIDLGAEYTIPIHYGTFMLGDDSPQSALLDLRQSIKKYNLNEFNFHILKLGETLTVDN